MSANSKLRKALQQAEVDITQKMDVVNWDLGGTTFLFKEGQVADTNRKSKVKIYR